MAAGGDGPDPERSVGERDDSPVSFTWWDAIEHFLAGHPGERLEEVLYWPRSRFDLLYNSYVRRTVVNELRAEQCAQVRAIISNGGYFNSKEAMDARKQEIETLNDHYQSAIDAIMDPDKLERERKELESNPLFAAGMRGLDRMKWDLQGAQGVAEQLQAQGF